MSDKELNVLLIDDDELELMWLKRQLKRLDTTCNVMHANDGAEAMAMLEEGALPFPNLIFLDVNMPRMDGHEFLSWLRQNPVYKYAVVFMVSSSNSMEDQLRAYENHVAGYLLKSFDSSSDTKLVELIRYYKNIVQLPPTSRVA